MILALLIATIYIALRNGAILFKIKIDISFLHKKRMFLVFIGIALSWRLY